MEEKEKRINTFLKSYFDAEHQSFSLSLDNLEVFWDVIQKFYTPICLLCEENNISIDFNRMSKMSFVEKECLIDDFFKMHGIDFKLDDIINNGTLDLNTVSISDINEYLNYYKGDIYSSEDHINILAYNTELLSDSIVWVHEIEHYRNEPKGERSKVSDLLTESLSFAMTLIYIDYLKSKGYKYEGTILLLEEIYNYYSFLKIGDKVVKLALVFDKLGCVSKENYDLLFDDNRYEDTLDDFIKNILDGSHRLMINSFLYNCGYPLAIYMYIMYKKNPLFIERIEELNSKINDFKSVNEFLKMLGLSGYNAKSFDLIIDAIFELKSQLNNELDSLYNNKILLHN